MNKTEIIEKIANENKNKFSGESSGHDWWHIYRVWQLSRYIATFETCNTFIVELAALLHDVADWKFNDGNDLESGRIAKSILENHQIENSIILQVVDIINHVTFKGAKVKSEVTSIEGKIVQDADRLDAIGAIGIARTFAYGGFRGRPMYDPSAQVVLHETFNQYKNNKAPTINHFYEKLLLLKDRMNTTTGKKLAIHRHEFMEAYLQEFFDEWDGKK